ncbi:MAG: MotA/TolQ/ExbB proton channel family protein [Alkalispirochaetaceae bacterium]
MIVDAWLGFAEEFSSMMRSGGFVMWPLLGAAVLLWFGIGYRAVTLRRGSTLPIRRLVSQFVENPGKRATGYVDSAAALAVQLRMKNSGQIRRILDDELFHITANMNRFRTLVRTIVIVAPLAGLLGTVTGMIEMFQSLGDQTFFSQSGGVANGISQALFTTQFGLVVAVPGMIAGRLMDRRENQMSAEVEQIKDMLSVARSEVHI